MTNFEFFKTVEGATAFYNENVEKLYNADTGVSAGRFIEWLYQEHVDGVQYNGEIEQCPFCGANCKIVSVESKSMYFLKCHCGCGYQSGYKSSAKAAVIEHNKFSKAVRSSK